MDVGQFMPGPEARPAIGDPGKLEFVEEDRVEVVVNDQGGGNFQLKGILKELKEVGSISHYPYSLKCDASSNSVPLHRRSIRMKRSRTTCTHWPRFE